MDPMKMLEVMKAGLLGPKTAGAQERAQATFGQGGLAGMANAQRQAAYKRYAEETISAGDEPMPYQAWLAQNYPDEYAPRKK